MSFYQADLLKIESWIEDQVKFQVIHENLLSTKEMNDILIWNDQKQFQIFSEHRLM